MRISDWSSDVCSSDLFDDAFMLVRKLKLPPGAHHAKALDATDGGDFQRHVQPRHIGPRLAEHADQPRPRLGRAAADLARRLAAARVTPPPLTLVPLRVTTGRTDARRDHGGRLRG